MPSFSEIHSWTNDELKSFLRKKGLQLSGCKEELAARVFCAFEQNLPDLKTAEEKEHEKLLTYQKLLCIEGCNLPDPLLIPSNDWISEGEAILKNLLPPTMLEDISAYLCTNDMPVDLHKKLLCDYKEQKAYSYFTSGWLSELRLHIINNKYCVVASDCCPSQRLNDERHHVWAIIEKSDSPSSSEIKSAFCTCFAGYGQTCNHIGAMLLRLDAIWQEGKQPKACTSLPCTWSQKGKATDLPPQKIKHIAISKPKLGNPGKGINSTPKKQHIPHDSSKGMQLNEFLSELEKVYPEAVFLAEASDERREMFKESSVNHSLDIPPPLCDIVQSSGNVEDYLERLTVEQKQSIEKATVQGCNEQAWKQYRQFLLTSTLFYAVKTKSETLMKNPQASVSYILDTITGSIQVNAELPALKYGRRNEPIAARELLKQLKKAHKNVVMQDCGLFIDQEVSALACTPDRIVTCDCHGKRLVEIKCPFNCRDAPVGASTCKFLVFDGTSYSLKKNHQYYYQVQGQMGITGVSSCYFFVYSRTKNSFLLRIERDEDFWRTLKPILASFYYTYFLPVVSSISK